MFKNIGYFPLLVLKGIDFTTGNIVIFSRELKEMDIIQHISWSNHVMALLNPHVIIVVYGAEHQAFARRSWTEAAAVFSLASGCKQGKNLRMGKGFFDFP